MQRKDRRGRNLRVGEDQMPNGRYRFRFTENDGTRRAVYSWRLLPSDRTPAGKRYSESLREKERRLYASTGTKPKTEEENRTGIPVSHPIKPKSDSEIPAFGTADSGTKESETPVSETPDTPPLTLNRLFSIYMEGKSNLKASTRSGYFYLWETYIAHNIGGRSITSIRYSDIRSFYHEMVTDGVPVFCRRSGRTEQGKPLCAGSVGVLHALLHPVFSLAVRDGRLTANPADHALAEIRAAAVRKSRKKKALTQEEQERFMEYILRTDRYRHLRPLFTAFLGTGCRIGELLGLRWEDCDFQRNLIRIDHILIYKRIGNENCRMHISTPKTESGCREIPMLHAVREMLLMEREHQQRKGFCAADVDGYRNFVFLNRHGRLFNPSCLNRQLVRICKAYNIEESERAAAENRPPVLLPHISAHSFRHTFCTRFCEHEPDLKVIQSVMGHADISTTMNIYAEATAEQTVISMKRLEGHMPLGGL